MIEKSSVVNYIPLEVRTKTLANFEKLETTIN